MYDTFRLFIGLMISVFVVIILIFYYSGKKIVSSNPGEACNDYDLKCGNNAICVSGICKLNTGNQCKKNIECLSNVCAGGRYCSDKNNYGQVLNPPDPSNGCNLGLEIDITGTLCLKSQDSVCFLDQECSSKICTNFNGLTGTCGKLPKIGETCKDVCSAGLYCSLGYCQNIGTVTGRLNSNCTNSGCNIGRCSNNYCIEDGTVKIGDLCGRDSNCEFGKCTENTCVFDPNDYSKCPDGYAGTNCLPIKNFPWFNSITGIRCKTNSDYHILKFRPSDGLTYAFGVISVPKNFYIKKSAFLIQSDNSYSEYDVINGKLKYTKSLNSGENVMNGEDSVIYTNTSFTLNGITTDYSPTGFNGFSYINGIYYAIFIQDTKYTVFKQDTRDSTPSFTTYYTVQVNNYKLLNIFSDTIVGYSGNTLYVDTLSKITKYNIPGNALDSAYISTFVDRINKIFLAVLIDSGDYAKLMYLVNGKFIEIPGKFSKSSKIAFFRDYLYILANYICQ